MLEPGSRFFSCEVVSTLSENSIYQSYLARCEDGASVRLLVSAAPLSDFSPYALDLAQRLAGYVHPGVAAPLRAGACEDKFVCIYPVVEGQPLEKFLLQKQWSVRSALELLQKIAGLLVDPHQNGLIHGNISPFTVVYADDGDLCLDGFSLTQLFKLDYQSGLDPAYISPEQVRGEEPVAASDIYSLGCVLYFQLTGLLPFTGADSFSVAMQHLQGAFPELPEGHCCRQLLSDMTCSASDVRLTVDQLLSRVQQLLDSEEIDQLQPFEALDTDGHVDEQPSQEVSPHAYVDDNQDFTARIEARLKEYSSAMTDPVEPSLLVEDDDEVTAALEQLPTEKQPLLWRYLAILIVGILVGSGLYFIFVNQDVEHSSEIIVQEEDISERLDLALLAWQNAEMDDAISRLKTLADQHADDPRPVNNLAAIYAAQGDYERAREYLERALKTDINYATIYNNLAAIYAEMARDSYGKALLIDQAREPLQLIALSSQGGVEVSAPTVAEDVKLSAVSVSAVSEVSEPAEPKIEDTVIEVEDNPDRIDTSLAVGTNIRAEETDTADEEPVVAAVEGPESPDVVGETNESLSVPADDGEPVAEAVVATPVVEGAEQFMLRWAKAWTQQDFAAYLACYDADFIPPGGKARIDWEKQRQQRIGKPKKIDVTLTGMQISPQNDGNVRFEAVQVYKSDVYTDKTRKVFNLRQAEGGWSILRERSLGSVK